MIRLTRAVALGLAAQLAIAAHAQPAPFAQAALGLDHWFETTELNASDGSPQDTFGYVVSVSGDVAVIGAFNDDDNGSNSGSAYIFERNGDGVWLEKAKLTAYDAEASDEFGRDVSISGNVAVIGASQDGDNGTHSGSVYVFERNVNGVWLPQAKLTASDGEPYDWFGLSVSVSGDVALIGAHGSDDDGSHSGSAYVFERNADGVWLEQAKLTASDAEASDYFGYDVSVSGDVAVIGAYRDDGSGSAYIFEKDDGSWPETEAQKLTASDSVTGDGFGLAVSVSGDVAVIGASWHSDNGSSSGAAYVFKRNVDGAWPEQLKLTASDGAPNDRFGISVSVSGDVALIGAYKDEEHGDDDSGSAYIFEKEDGVWPETETQKLTASEGAPLDYFGFSVSVSGDRGVIGAYRHDHNGAEAGSVYVFEATTATCTADLDGDGDTDSNDFFAYLGLFAIGDPRADINGDGIIDADDFFAYLDLFALGCP